VFSSLVIVFAFPALLVIAIAIRLSSTGPILFAQERVGLKAQIFRMYKFRTMRVSNSEEAGTRWTIRHDPRCTKIGAFLRRTSLDELPQFFNVLKGDMSVVGPRPERPFFVRKFSKELQTYNSRHYVKAGITGWAQVNGFRGDTSICKRVQYDLYYLRHWSIGFDLQIILLPCFAACPTETHTDGAIAQRGSYVLTDLSRGSTSQLCRIFPSAANRSNHFRAFPAPASLGWFFK
jgi:exopolysaccharide biosynthesis polyprenyl glycosylphosphotransferase